MSRNEAFKQKYKDQWGLAKKRQQIVMDFLREQGFEVWVTGLMADSEEYTPETATEAGIPDLMARKEGMEVFIEVTGQPKAPRTMWIRPDKIQYADKHPDKEVWLAFVVDQDRSIWFLPTKAFTPAVRRSIVNVKTTHHGISEMEHYIEIPMPILPGDFINAIGRP
jgi:hypothetical protein